jgi:hypothetical protein
MFSMGFSQLSNLWSPLLLTDPLFFAFIALVTLLLIQIIVGALYKRQIFFLLQAKVFRFVLFNLLFNYCMWQIKQGSSLTGIYVTVAVVLAIFAFAINYLAFKESFLDESIRRYF